MINKLKCKLVRWCLNGIVTRIYLNEAEKALKIELIDGTELNTDYTDYKDLIEVV